MLDLRKRRGFSLIELLIVIAIILIIIMIAVPKYQRSLMYTKEMAAIAAVKTIHQAQVQYSSQFSKFATSLAELGPPASGGANASAADMIGNDLSNGLKQGYKFTVTGSPGGYIVTAVPEFYNSSGSRTFYSDQTMVIHEHYGPEPATVQDPELK
jgi:type IV pilus assembly protein PilA